MAPRPPSSQSGAHMAPKVAHKTIRGGLNAPNVSLERLKKAPQELLIMEPVLTLRAPKQPLWLKQEPSFLLQLL